MDKLERQLSQLQYSFSPEFEDEILQKTVAKPFYKLPSLNWFMVGIAASIVLCISIVYLQDGSLTLDSILGTNTLSDYNSDYIFNYL